MDSESQLQQRGDNFITNRELKMNNKIRVARAEARMTQQQLAEAAGVSRQTINAIESGKFVPSTVLALKMAKIFNRPVEEIFQLDDED